MEIGLSVSPTRPWRTAGGPFSGHATLTSGLVSYWKLNEVSGDRADSVGSNTLTDNNTVTSVAGMRSLAAEFTAANSESLTKASVVLPDLYSVSLWAKLVSTPVDAYPTPFSVNTQGSGWPNESQLTVFVHPNGSLYTVVSDGTAGVQTQSNLSPVLGQWYHLLFTFDSDKKLRVYVDGVLVDTSAAVTGTPFRTASPLGIGYGMGYVPSVSTWDGQLDEFGLWSRVLTAQERTDLYNSGAGLFY